MSVVVREGYLNAFADRGYVKREGEGEFKR